MRYTYTSKQTSKRSTHTFAGFFGIFSTSINQILLYFCSTKEYNTKLSTTPKTYDDSQNTRHRTPSAPQLQNISHNHALSLVPRNFRRIALTELISTSHRHTQSPIIHILTQQKNFGETYEQFIEQPHTTNFRSQINPLFSPR